MFKKLYKDMNNFTLDIKTIKSHDELLDYMNSSFYASVKLLLAVSKTFSICWMIVIPFFISLGGVLILSSIDSIAKQMHSALNTTFIFSILLVLVLFKIVLILHCKNYLTSCIEKSKSLMEEVIQRKE